jgi:hypothetical protein
MTLAGIQDAVRDKARDGLDDGNATGGDAADDLVRVLGVDRVVSQDCVPGGLLRGFGSRPEIRA